MTARGRGMAFVAKGTCDMRRACAFHVLETLRRRRSVGLRSEKRPSDGSKL